PCSLLCRRSLLTHELWGAAGRMFGCSSKIFPPPPPGQTEGQSVELTPFLNFSLHALEEIESRGLVRHFGPRFGLRRRRTPLDVGDDQPSDLRFFIWRRNFLAVLSMAASCSSSLARCPSVMCSSMTSASSWETRPAATETRRRWSAVALTTWPAGATEGAFDFSLAAPTLIVFPTGFGDEAATSADTFAARRIAASVARRSCCRSSGDVSASSSAFSSRGVNWRRR